MKLLLEHREENIEVFSPWKNKQFLVTSLKIHRKNLKKLANFF